MPNQELIDYIKKSKNAGVKEEEIKKNLLENGWAKDVIGNALSGQLSNSIPVPLPPKQNASTVDLNKNTKESLTMWDAFQHILLFISLYVMATSIGLLFNYLVDVKFPGLQNYYSSYSSGSWQSMLVNGYVASIIVSTPIFSALYLLIQRRTIKNPEIRNLPTRKKLIYLTLILTFAITLFQVVRIVWDVLNGNITLNALLHFWVTVGISGIVFINYFLEVKQDAKINA